MRTDACDHDHDHQHDHDHPLQLAGRKRGILAFLATFHNRTILFRKGRVVFVTYGLVNGLAFVLATLAALTYTRMAGRDPMVLLTASVFVVLPCALIGARLFSILLEWRQLFAKPFETIVKPGYMLHGGVLGGVVGMALYGLVMGVPMLHLMDAWAFAMPLGEGVARIGCHVYGCCWGAPTNSRFGIRYTSPHAKVVRMAPHLAGRRIYPAQLFGTVTHLGQFCLILALVPLFAHAGMVTAAYLVTHAVARITLERFRQDDRGKLIGPLTHTNLYSALQIMAGGALLALSGSLPPMTPATYASPIGVVIAQPGALGFVLVIFLVAVAAFGVHIDRVGTWVRPVDDVEPGASSEAHEANLNEVEAR